MSNTSYFSKRRLQHIAGHSVAGISMFTIMAAAGPAGVVVFPFWWCHLIIGGGAALTNKFD